MPKSHLNEFPTRGGPDVEYTAVGAETGYRLHALESAQIVQSFPWREIQPGKEGLRLWVAGSPSNVDYLLEAIAGDDRNAVREWCVEQRTCFGFIAVNNGGVITAVDRVSGYPVYYRRDTDSKLEIATDTRYWLETTQSLNLNSNRIEEFQRAGYCTGKRTLIDGISRVLPGEVCFFTQDDTIEQSCRYSIFSPEFSEDSHFDIDQWENRLKEALRNSVRRLIDRAKGNRIWLPLSAGFDSRALLALLVEQGYPNVHCFSYGNPGNMEADVARDLAKQAGVSWEFINSKSAWSRREFHGDEGSDYFLYAGGLGTTPSFTEYSALRAISRSGRFGEGDIMINGQSGDFLTGGHLPDVASEKELLRLIDEKHFSLNKEIQDEQQSFVSRWWSEWSEEYPLDWQSHHSTKRRLQSHFEFFEWQERQSRYVVNQQRAYDYLGLRWELPLWDADLIDLYNVAPLECHRDQRLYLGLLKKWNPVGLFTEGRKPYNPWMNRQLPIIALGGFARIFGKRKEMYRALYYFSDWNYQYSYYGYKTYYAHRKKIRNPVTFFACDYIRRLLSLPGSETSDAVLDELQLFGSPHEN